jgi:hypothetical protein
MVIEFIGFYSQGWQQKLPKQYPYWIQVPIRICAGNMRANCVGLEQADIYRRLSVVFVIICHAMQ